MTKSWPLSNPYDLPINTCDNNLEELFRYTEINKKCNYVLFAAVLVLAMLVAQQLL